MFPLVLKPDQAVKELVDFNQKLAAGLRAMGEMGPIDEGVTPYEVVYQEDKMRLLRYNATVDKPHPVPMLVVYALVNRPYMTDIQEDRSTIRGLLDEGMDVYLVDWGYPDGSDRFLGLDDYINGYIHSCVKFICDQHDLDSINLLGICQGGTFSLCYTALHPEWVKNLVTMVTPVDFHDPSNMLTCWARYLDIDLIVDTMGNLPGELLNWTFLSLNPYRLTGQKYLDMVKIMDKPEKLKNFMRMEKWIFDSPDQAGEAFRQFIKDFYQNNGLVKGVVRIGDRRVDLGRITMPVLNVYATKDHLVPPPCTLALKKYVGSDDYSELAFAGGHIGIYVSGRAQREVPPAISEWLQERG